MTSDRATIELQVRSLLADVSAVDTGAIGPATALRDLGLDSVTALDVVQRLEDAFDVRIPEEDALHLDTVGAIVRYVARQRG